MKAVPPPIPTRSVGVLANRSGDKDKQIKELKKSEQALQKENEEGKLE